MPSGVLSPDTLKHFIPDLDFVGPRFDGGGFKSVYTAMVKGRKEALKVLMIRKPEDARADREIADAFCEEQVARARREIRALDACRVPELVKLGAIAPVEFDFEEQKYIAYSEEFLEGSDLWKLIKNQWQPPALVEVVQLFRSLLKCIQELWKHGYVHRDIKPANVIKTTDSDRPFVLLDLGIAYAVCETSLTFKADERMPLATFRYLAPEMMQPDFREHIDYRTDLYTTGMTVFEYAAGQHPLARNSDDMMRTITRALHQPPSPLSTYRPDLPDELRTLVDSLLKKKPALRPANMAILFRKLEDIA
jgi:eukaryotic-like serine/threonine-protein kinase